MLQSPDPTTCITCGGLTEAADALLSKKGEILNGVWLARSVAVFQRLLAGGSSPCQRTCERAVRAESTGVKTGQSQGSNLRLNLPERAASAARTLLRRTSVRKCPSFTAKLDFTEAAGLASTQSARSAVHGDTGCVRVRGSARG